MAFAPFTTFEPITPQIVDWPSKIGRLVALSATPCSPTPQIVAYGFFVSLPILVITLFKPDAQDSWLHRFGRPHKRRRKWGIKHGTIIFPQEPIPKGWATATWLLGEWAQRLGWYFLVVDATTDFLINWTSLIYAYSGCPSQGMPYLHQQNAGVVYGGETHWRPFVNFAFAGGQEIISHGQGIVAPAKSNVIVNLSAVCDPFPTPSSPLPGFQTRVIDKASGYVVAQSKPSRNVGGRAYAQATGTFANPFAIPHGLDYEILCDGQGAGNFDPSTADSWAYGSVGIEPDP